jgi:hypothetical protein
MSHPILSRQQALLHFYDFFTWSTYRVGENISRLLSINNPEVRNETIEYLFNGEFLKNVILNTLLNYESDFQQMMSTLIYGVLGKAEEGKIFNVLDCTQVSNIHRYVQVEPPPGYQYLLHRVYHANDKLHGRWDLCNKATAIDNEIPWITMIIFTAILIPVDKTQLGGFCEFVFGPELTFPEIPLISESVEVSIEEIEPYKLQFEKLRRDISGFVSVKFQKDFREDKFHTYKTYFISSSLLNIIKRSLLKINLEMFTEDIPGTYPIVCIQDVEEELAPLIIDVSEFK